MSSALPKGELLRKLSVAGLRSAAELQAPAPPMVSWGVAEVDALTGGLPRGALTELVGRASSGRTGLLLSAMAQMTLGGEVCALVDTSDSFDPGSAVAAGVNLDRLLWVRCGSYSPRRHADAQAYLIPGFRVHRGTRHGKRETLLLEQALKATDLLLQGGGFGLVAIDLGDIAPETARRVPLTSWFRFRRTVEPTPTVLLVIEQEPYAKTCASLVVKTAGNSQWSDVGEHDVPPHANLLRGISVEVEVLRARVEHGGRKPAQSARFASRVQWAG